MLILTFQESILKKSIAEGSTVIIIQNSVDSSGGCDDKTPHKQWYIEGSAESVQQWWKALSQSILDQGKLAVLTANSTLC